MPPVQTEYPENIRQGVAGQVANQVPRTIISRSVETAAIGFGLAVSQGVDDNGCIAYTDNFVGITVRERSLPAEQDDLQVGDSAGLLTQGSIWAVATVSVAAGDAVHPVAGGGLSNTGGVAIPGARWDTSAGIGELAIVRID